MNGQVPTIFIDTAFLRSIPLRDSKLQSLLKHSKQGNVVIYISQVSLEEWRTSIISSLLGSIVDIQSKIDYFNSRMDRSLIRDNIEIPFIIARHPTKEQIQEASKRAFHSLIIDHKIHVISYGADHSERAWKAYFDFHPPFSKEKERSDIPDAWIYIAAQDVKEMCEQPLFLCKKNSNDKNSNQGIDKNLWSALESIGYQKIPIDDLLANLDARESQLTQAEHETSTIVDINAELQKIAEDENELKIRIMGYVSYFAPIPKDTLIEYLSRKGYSPELVENVINIIVLNQSIKPVGQSYIPHNQALCEEAARRVTEEIVSMLEEY